MLGLVFLLVIGFLALLAIYRYRTHVQQIGTTNQRLPGTITLLRSIQLRGDNTVKIASFAIQLDFDLSSHQDVECEFQIKALDSPNAAEIKPTSKSISTVSSN